LSIQSGNQESAASVSGATPLSVGRQMLMDGVIRDLQSRSPVSGNLSPSDKNTNVILIAKFTGQGLGNAKVIHRIAHK